MEKISADAFAERYGTDTLQEAQQFKSARRGAESTPIRDFAFGAVDMFAATGRPIQNALPRSLSTIPNLATGEPGVKGNEQGEEGRFANVGATADTPAANAGEVVGFIGELVIPSGAASKAPKVASNLAERASSLSDDAFEGVAEIKGRLIDIASSLDDKTKTALERTDRATLDRFLTQAERASKDDRIRTPLEGVGDSVIQALKDVKERASFYGKEKDRILKSAQLGFTKINTRAKNTAEKIKQHFANMQIDESDRKIINEIEGRLRGLGDNPLLKDVDQAIDVIQDRLYKSSRSNVVEVTDRVTGPIRRYIGELNGQVQDLGGEAYKSANKNYAELQGTIRELNARLGKEGSSAGSFVKRLFSPSDARTKELFEELQGLTGQDFFRDARLAKFSMEVFGDTRAQSLLDQIPSIQGSLVERGFDAARKFLSDPAEAARRFIDRTNNP